MKTPDFSKFEICECGCGGVFAPSPDDFTELLTYAKEAAVEIAKLRAECSTLKEEIGATHKYYMSISNE